MTLKLAFKVNESHVLTKGVVQIAPFLFQLSAFLYFPGGHLEIGLQGQRISGSYFSQGSPSVDEQNRKK
jgi:hypothetical protein